jgi:hypothetical protein
MKALQKKAEKHENKKGKRSSSRGPPLSNSKTSSVGKFSRGKRPGRQAR